jgi:CRP/FNR family transcriptional regulator, anaerobic regulatory protein
MQVSVRNASKAPSSKEPGHIAALIRGHPMAGAAPAVFATKQHVFLEGDEKDSVFLIEQGLLALYRTTAEGKRQVFGFGLPGDVIGLGAAQVHSCNAQAITSLEVRRLPTSSLNRLASEDPDFALRLYQAVSSELEAARDLLMALARHDALERVAIFLLTMSRRNALNGRNPALVTLPMTRADIADLLGVTVETVSRSLSKLKKCRMIEIIRNTTVQIIDMNGLNALLGRATYH